MLKDVDIAEALRLLLELPVTLDSEPVPIADALGRVASEDIVAEIPFPPFDRSAFDGYALRRADVEGATKKKPVTLEVRQEIPAGFLPVEPVTSGFAAKILTGAPIPEGADAVVKFEDTVFDSDSVTFFGPVKGSRRGRAGSGGSGGSDGSGSSAGSGGSGGHSAGGGPNIVRAGEDIPAGATILPMGALIEPAVLGLLAAQGMKFVRVYKRPVVSIVNTGSELAELGRPLPPGMIYNSSMLALQGYLKRMGAVFRDGGIVGDDERAIAARVRAELKTADMLITTGGASVGDYDCAVAAAERAGAAILFWKIKMRPGGSLLAYTLNGKLVLSLSGNPGAAALGFMLLGYPCIKKRQGFANTEPEVCTVKLAKKFPKPSKTTRVLRGSLTIKNGDALFIENEGQGGGDISSLVCCDLLAIIPAGSPPLPAGAQVQAYRIFK